MIREEKLLIIDNLTAWLAESNVIYVTDLAGLNVQDTSVLRYACFRANIKLTVIKNTLPAKAMEAPERGFGELSSILKGDSSPMYAEVGNAPAKLIREFHKKPDKPILKGAYIDSAVYIDGNQLDVLVAIKSKNEIIGDIIGLLRSPVKNVVSILRSGDGKLAGIIKTLSGK